MLNTEATAQIYIDQQAIFYGRCFTQQTTKQHLLAELVFNTATTGYEELITDPSYRGQAVVMTYPLIGNYGITLSDAEAPQANIKALIVKEYIPNYSNWEAKMSLKQYLEQQNIVGIERIDTRALTKIIREKGSVNAAISINTTINKETKQQLNNFKLATKTLIQEIQYPIPKKYQLSSALHNIAILNFGYKSSIVQQLQQYHCNCTIFPYNYPPEAILQHPNIDFDGLILSNGPGDPNDLKHFYQYLLPQYIGKIPILGICLGHQLLALQTGLTVGKLSFGHHGINHPVLDKTLQKIIISSQNHNYYIKPFNDQNNQQDYKITHINLIDHTIAGMRHKYLPIMSVQFHPEAGPGTEDGFYIFKQFLNNIQKNK